MEILSLFYRSSFYITAFLISLFSLVYTFIRGKVQRKQNRVYIDILICIMIAAASSIVDIFAGGLIPDPVICRRVTEVCLFVYFVSHAFQASFLYVYMIYITGSIHLYRKRRGLFTLLMLPFVLMLLLVLINLFNSSLYYLDEENVYVRGPLMIVYYFLGAVYFVIAFRELVIRWNSVTPRCRNGLSFLYVPTMLGVIVQFFEPRLQVELFFQAVAAMGVMVFIESDEERMDVSSGLFNRNALSIDMNNYISMEQDFSVIVVHVLNEDLLGKLTGNYSYEGIMDGVAGYLKTLMPYYNIYKVGPECFVLVTLGQSEEGTESICDKIKDRFQKPFRYEDIELELAVALMKAGYPSDIHTADEVFLMTDSSIPLDMYGKVAADAGLARIRRSIMVEKALRRGFTDHNFEVYYQPVYFLENLGIHSAEALIRLHDNELGDIPPAEFIPIAEYDGIIDRIGDYVLEEVCLFLSSGLPVEMGIEFISINLSILQCVHPGFVKRIREMTRRYDISPSLLCFEIKEATATGYYKILKDLISELKGYGFRFSMDSYGTGFSDMKALYSLDFDLVKIDHSILTRAENGSIGRIILESCVRMIRQLHRRIIVEGVESKEQIRILKKLEVDYVQGYYSSRPITKNELLGILRVTELAKMEERRAIAASEAKSSFLANMSHEIRTPINAVLGMNEMILRECDEDAVAGYAKEIETAGRNLLSLINNILDYSKIEAGEMEIVEAEYELKKTLADIIRETYQKTEKKHLAFRTYVSDKLPARLYGDAFRIKQVIMNLLNNAVKYTNEGSVHLTVGGERKGDDVMLKIVVEDTGCGIKDEDQSKLYEMFQRLDMEKNRTVEGSGLGLAISHHLLQMMHGDIEVESKYGKGSTFRARLMQKAVGSENIEAFSQEELRDISRGVKRSRSFTAPDARLLLIDDTPLNHTVIKELLKQSRIRIDTALSGEEGLDMAKSRHYDLMFMDRRMPGMSGSEALKKLKGMEGAASRRTPVISMTADFYPGIREAERKEGFADYLEKPVESAKLSEILLQYLPESKVFYI